MAKDKAPAHAALRIKSEDGLTISAHRNVIDKSGSVLFAKLGRGFAASFINQLNAQLEHNIPTFLFLATHEGKDQPYGYYRCKILKVYQSINEKQKSLVPEYIHGMIPAISTYFEISSIERISRQDSNRIYILSSGRELSSAIHGTTSIFKVGIKGTSDMDKVADPAPQQKSSSDSALDLDDPFQNDDDEFVDGWYNSLDI